MRIAVNLRAIGNFEFLADVSMSDAIQVYASIPDDSANRLELSIIY